MARLFFAFLILSLFVPDVVISQKKVLQAARISERISIDGNLTETSWDTALPASDFIMFVPDNGKPISPERKTEVKIIYDDDAIYVAAIMYDEDPSKIHKEMTQRDNFGTAEHFGIFLNGFNDGQQDFRFFVSAAGVQMDCVATESMGEDFSWDAIWDSNVTITNFGWIAEMKIPYAALRFSNSEKQTWGVNFYREIRRDRHQFTWNFIDRKVGAELTQSGILEGIENIKPPTRLFFIPYSSFYLYANENQKTIGDLKGGLDIKYGINDAFTLDMILVPDFGQTRFDNVELYLGPFEQTFSETRPFFTEGTDLFSKGNLLYSRRIGESPSIEVASNEEVEDFPSTIKLINALKISGRTKGGLGIGLLNAVTEQTSVNVRNLDTNTSRLALLQPVSNYSVMVLDQRFRKNSSVSFVNTNVTRSGHFRDANVSAVVFDLNTKDNTYNVNGNFKYSFINQPTGTDKTGYNTALYMAETSGKFRYGVGGQYISTDFDIDDMGLTFETHLHAIYGNASYRILAPNKTFNSFETYLNVYSEFDNMTGRVQQGNVTFNINSTTLKNDYYGLGINTRVVETFDFYEPRFNGRFVYIPRNFGAYLYFSSNYNRKFALDIQPSMTLADERHREVWSLFVGPRYRFSDRVTANLGFNFIRQNNNTGYIDNSYSDANTPFDIYFAKRNRTTYIFSTGGKYSINKDMTINLIARYYWSYVENREFFTLTDEGYLAPSTYDEDVDSNFNTWNLDFSYSWWFAPGSQVSVLYRNNAGTFVSDINKDLGNNFSNLFRDNLNHVFSISVRYFIDYNQAKNWF